MLHLDMKSGKKQKTIEVESINSEYLYPVLKKFSFFINDKRDIHDKNVLMKKFAKSAEK